MWPTVFLLGACVSLNGVSAQAATPAYAKVGDDVVLKPGSLPNTINRITWFDGKNIAVDWDSSDRANIDYKRHFKGHSSLNTSNGELTLTRVNTIYSGTYKPNINDYEGTTTNLIVLFPVPVATVKTNCDDDKTSCTLTCDGNTTGAEPVNYRWKSDDIDMADSSKMITVNEKDNSSKEFTCELENPVSLQRSQPITNPFFITDSTSNGVQPNINTGVIVFICLLVPLLLLVFIHRWRAGMWFYEKDSMPWEADFWKNKRNSRAAETEGTAAHKATEQSDAKMLRD